MPKLKLIAGLAALAIVVPSFAAAEVHEFTVDPSHSQVGFKIRHLVAKVPGSFQTFSGMVWMDPENIEGTLKLEGKVETASVYTANEDRDNHLRSPDFFNVEKHPEMTLVSKSVKKQDDDEYLVTADFTMLGVTKEIELEVEYGGVTPNPFTGTPTTGLEIEAEIDRKEYGMVWNKALDAGGVVLGDEVKMQIQLEATVMVEKAEG